MGEWKEYRLDEIAEILDYKRKPLSSMQRSVRKGEIPYYGASGIIDYIDDYIFEGEHVLISEDGENLRSRQTPIAFLADGKFWVNNHAHIIKSDYIHNRLICYYFANFDLNPFLTGAVQPKLSQDSLMRIPIFLPKSIEDRKQIVSIIASVDDKIDLLYQENKTLEAMAETLFRQWFIEGAKEEWEEKDIYTYAEHYKVSIVPNKHPQMFFRHYSIPAFDNGKEASLEKGECIQSNKYIVPGNCILFSKLNPHKDKRVWLILDGIENNAICSTEFQIIKPKKSDYLYFLYGWLTSKENYEEISSGVGGTSGSHQRIDPKSIFTFSCPNADIETIYSYNKMVGPLYYKQKLNENQIINLKEQRDKLLQKLMSNK